MPMDKKNTTKKHQCPKCDSAHAKKPCVSEQTLAFLRSFASNYYVDSKLPQGIQGIILG